MDFELGPIRPPSEAYSLLVRVTRNCPHNRCSFCPVYRDERFSIRRAEEVEQDIEAMAEVAKLLQQGCRPTAAGWRQVSCFLATGACHAFLQDANSLAMPAAQLVRVVIKLKRHFPTLTRITSYARAHTLTRRSLEDLRSLRQAGLNRLHVGLESGSDSVLERIQKGVTAERHIEAGRRALEAGFELSEYVMPGLGGEELTEEHALETARVLSAIQPQIIRLRTLMLVPKTPLWQAARRGEFKPLGEVEVVEEIRLLIANVKAKTRITSDHLFNLLGELNGELPGDRPRLLAIIDRFLGLPPSEQEAFIAARRGPGPLRW